MSDASDPDTVWRPRADVAVLRARASMLKTIRAYFDAHGVLEVETPCLSSAAAMEPSIEPLAVHAAAGRRWLHTSPELAMKRLLAAGIGDIYQIARVFRDAEQGQWHNPEFTLLEWYRVGFSAAQLRVDVQQLLADITTMMGQPLAPPVTTTYAALFKTCLQVDPLVADEAELRAVATARGLSATVWDHSAAENRQALLDGLFATQIQPTLRGLTWVVDYPAEQAAMARRLPDKPDCADRFELYWDDVELANGYRELTDAAEQTERLHADQRRRLARGGRAVPLDRRFIAAMQAGLPACAGIALGLDRLLMCLLGLASIDEVLAFPAARA